LVSRLGFAVITGAARVLPPRIGRSKTLACAQSMRPNGGVCRTHPRLAIGPNHDTADRRPERSPAIEATRASETTRSA
jgi:hypothetical protein